MSQPRRRSLAAIRRMSREIGMVAARQRQREKFGEVEIFGARSEIKGIFDLATLYIILGMNRLWSVCDIIDLRVCICRCQAFGV